MYAEPLSLLEKVECTQPPVACRIIRIECFRFDGVLSDQLLPGHDNDCHCGMLFISTNHGACGQGEYVIPCGKPTGDFAQWALVFQKLKGLTLEEGLSYVQQKEAAWGETRSHLIESALSDLSVKLKNSIPSGQTVSMLANRTYLFDHSEAYVSF